MVEVVVETAVVELVEDVVEVVLLLELLELEVVELEVVEEVVELEVVEFIATTWSLRLQVLVSTALSPSPSPFIPDVAASAGAQCGLHDVDIA